MVAGDVPVGIDFVSHCKSMTLFNIHIGSSLVLIDDNQMFPILLVSCPRQM